MISYNIAKQVLCRFVDNLIKFKKPLTFTEKIIFNHLDDDKKDITKIIRGKSFIKIKPDRVAMQDATAQMAILQFMETGVKKSQISASIHCDHLIIADQGAGKDLKKANKENQEIYDFLKSAANKYGIVFWGPGSGIIHQIVLEKYAFPGGFLLGTDSHTPNAGGLGMLSIGVGGGDVVDVMAGYPWEFLMPEIIGVYLEGELTDWVCSKDIILKILSLLTVKGATNKVLEYFGPGVKNLSATARATITNMGAELGATSSIFPYDHRIYNYLIGTGRQDLAYLMDNFSNYLSADEKVYQNPQNYYDKVVKINLNDLKPSIAGPHSPDLFRNVFDFKKEVLEGKYPRKISSALIGSCTNSSYEDMCKVYLIAKEANKQGVKSKMPLYISPGSEQIYETIKKDGILKELEKFGAILLSNACGPCIGQWKRDINNEKNVIVSSFNRNFQGRNDGNPNTLHFITSPELVMAYAVSGDLSFNPITDKIKTYDDKSFKIPPPSNKFFPSNGFFDRDFKNDKNNLNLNGIVITDEPDYKYEPDKIIHIKKDSDRIQILGKFNKWSQKDFIDNYLLVKTKGKTTTDHISPAGIWLKFRGHIDNISSNMLSKARNAFNDKIGKSLNLITGKEENISDIARFYKSKNKKSVIVGDANYGEGSSREHAAMSPRYLGVSTVIVKSFARIHETNLKKQGILALTFEDISDYDRILEGDIIDILGIDDFYQGSLFTVNLKHKDGSFYKFKASHSYNDYQISCFKYGSFLNYIGNTQLIC